MDVKVDRHKMQQSCFVFLEMNKLFIECLCLIYFNLSNDFCLFILEIVSFHHFIGKNYLKHPFFSF